MAAPGGTHLAKEMELTRPATAPRANRPFGYIPALLAAALLLTCVPLRAGEPLVGKLIASKEPGWPQWRGPRRNGISDETGLLQSWPQGGPKRLWTVSDIGRGYSSPIITGGTLYITGDVGSELRVFAFDLDGKPKWQTTNGRSWKRSWPGSRSSCTVDAGRLFLMNALGRVACLDPANGKELWSVNILERFGGKYGTWGLAECLLVDGPRVIVTPGGKKALMAALDRNTGKTLWTTEPIAKDAPAYASPILFELAGRRQIASYSGGHAFGVDAESGKLLWKLPWSAGRQMLGIMPVLDGDAVIVSSSSIKGGLSARIRLRPTDDGVEAKEVWTAPVDDLHGTSILLDGRLYGSGHRTHKGWACLDARTGEILYKASGLVKGSVMYADGRLYCLSENGIMSLLEATTAGFQTRGQFRLAKARKPDVWPHPVICDGRLYLRYHDKLWCYDIKK